MPSPDRNVEFVELDHRNLTEHLQQLTAGDRYRYPLISLYLNTAWADPQAKEKARIFFKDRLGWLDGVRRHELHGGDIKHLADDLEFLNEYVPAVIAGVEHANYDGICLFVSRKCDLRRAYLSSFAFENQCSLGDVPHVRQLARLRNGYNETLVAIVDHRTGRVYDIDMAEIRSRGELSTPVHRRHHAGGWSQMRFQRHVDDQIMHHLKEVATYLTKAFDTNSPQHVILAGSETSVSELEKFLPDRVRQKILREVRMTTRSTDADVVWTAVDILQNEERRDQEDLVENVVGTALAGSLAILGRRAVVESLNKRAVDAICYRSDLDEPAWACHDCGHLCLEQSACPSCGDPCKPGDLREEATLAALRQSAEVHEVAPGGRLDTYGGIGARLRFRY
jgi:peptide chain release factor subunit 1